MPAVSIAPSAPAIPWVKYDKYGSYKAEAGVFKIQGKDGEPVTAPKLKVYVACLRSRATVKLGDKEYVSQDFDSWSMDKLQLKDSEDYKSAPAFFGTVEELFGKYDRLTNRWTGGSAGSDVKFGKVFTCLTEAGEKLKLELSSATAKRAWNEAVKERGLDKSYALVFTAKEDTVKVGEGKKTKVVHEITVEDGGAVSAEIKSKVDALAQEVLAESVELQKRLNSGAKVDAPAAVAEPSGEPVKTEDIPF